MTLFFSFRKLRWCVMAFWVAQSSQSEHTLPSHDPSNSNELLPSLFQHLKQILHRWTELMQIYHEGNMSWLKFIWITNYLSDYKIWTNRSCDFLIVILNRRGNVIFYSIIINHIHKSIKMCILRITDF